MARRRNCGGFTLVEVMIASTVMALVFGGFVWGATQAARLQYMTDRHYVAALLARNRCEESKVMAYGALDSLTETQTVVDRDGNADANGTFRRSTSSAISANNTNCTEVLVSVWYQERPGRYAAAPVQFRALIANTW